MSGVLLVVGLVIGAVIGFFIARQSVGQLEAAAREAHADVSTETQRRQVAERELKAFRSRFLSVTDGSFQEVPKGRLSPKLAAKIAREVATVGQTKEAVVVAESGLTLSRGETSETRRAGALVPRLSTLKRELGDFASLSQLVVETDMGAACTFRPLSFSNAWLFARSQSSTPVSELVIDALLVGYRSAQEPSALEAPLTTTTADGETGLAPLLAETVRGDVRAASVLVDGEVISSATHMGPELERFKEAALRIETFTVQLPERALGALAVRIESAFAGGLRLTWFAVNTRTSVVVASTGTAFTDLDATRLAGRINLQQSSQARSAA